jgi:hypothetical protein
MVLCRPEHSVSALKRSLCHAASAALVLMAIPVLAACGQADAKPGSSKLTDPGDPGTTFGPKADGDLFVTGSKVGYIMYTAVCPKRNDRAHLFAVPENRASEGVASYYISLVFDDRAWKKQDYVAPLAGEIRFEMKDGLKYSATAEQLEAKLTVDMVGDSETEYYLVGKLELSVPSTTEGDEPLVVHSQINNPAAASN